MKFLLTAIMCLTLVLPVFAEEGKSSVKKTESLIIYFDTAKADLSEEGIEALKELAVQAENNYLRIIVLGNADERGDRLYNLDLGDRRAKAVKEKLIELGVEGYQIYAASYGEEKPAVPHGIKDNLAENRRAEVIPLLVPKAIEREILRNRVTLHGGVGPFLLHKHIIDPFREVEVYQSYNPVFGLGYARLITDRWSIGLSGYTNLTFLLQVGFDF